MAAWPEEASGGRPDPTSGNTSGTESPRSRARSRRRTSARSSSMIAASLSWSCLASGRRRSGTPCPTPRSTRPAGWRPPRPPPLHLRQPCTWPASAAGASSRRAPANSSSHASIPCEPETTSSPNFSACWVLLAVPGRVIGGSPAKDGFIETSVYRLHVTAIAVRESPTGYLGLAVPTEPARTLRFVAHESPATCKRVPWYSSTEVKRGTAVVPGSSQALPTSPQAHASRRAGSTVPAALSGSQ